MELDGNDANIKLNPDGSASFSTKSGGVYAIDKQGNVSINLQRIESVGIHNLADVAEHNIERVAGLISHFVRFVDGGEARFAYNTQGQLVDLSAANVGVSVSNQNEILFRRKKRAAA